MSKFYFLLLFLCLANADPVKQHGSQKPSLDRRIIGGSVASITDFPYQLSFQDWGAHICGAAIIGSYWAVSAAHCFNNAPTPRLRAGTAQLGVGGTVHEVDRYVLHEQFNSWSMDNDIALLHVVTPFQFSSSVQPIGLPSQGQVVAAGTQAVVSGWGLTSADGSEDSSVLLYLNTVVFSQTQCNSFYSDYGGLASGMMCSGYAEAGKDACQGDSGGPLASGGKLVGIVSWGDGCGKAGRPGVYTDVAYYRNWISSNSGI
ncbi:trypsin-1-like [Bacillus rossius redtenbacheri]|uniref:trypsin-1-like n=1 Tax=Bacillus rossius redtenbacheri TaxID=93214 RepID=UPI002FDC8F0C